MDQPEIEPSEDHLDRLSERPAEEADAVRRTRLRRDRALSPADRLDKLAAICRQADLLRTARRLP
jgi:hypothetical protein